MSVLAAFALPHPPIILPQIGRGEESKIIKTANACREAMRRAASLGPETVIVISPHSAMYADYIHISPGSAAKGDMGRFNAREVKFSVNYDTEFISALCAAAKNENIPAGTKGEKSRELDHGTMIPLYFLNMELGSYKLVRISLSGLSPSEHYRFGEYIKKTADKLGRRVVIIASGDLSHKLNEDGPYGFAAEGPVFDKKVTEALTAGDFSALLDIDPALSEAAAECGLRSFQIMAGALDRTAVKSELLSYEGPFGVGYGVACFECAGYDGERDFGDKYERKERKKAERRRAGEDAFVKLARFGAETFIKTGRRASLPEGLEPELTEKRAGVFVSLKKHGNLRGCIGTISPVTPSIAEEILQNAVSAAADDPRFDPVREDELPYISYSVDVLGETEEIDTEDKLDVKRYGVIVRSGGRRGLLLPNLEGVDTVKEQIAIARRKAGIRPDEKVSLSRFEVVRHK